MAGKSERQFRKYLRGQAEPPAQVLARVAEASGQTMEWLLTGDDASGRPIAEQRTDHKFTSFAAQDPKKAEMLLRSYQASAAMNALQGELSKELVELYGQLSPRELELMLGAAILFLSDWPHERWPELKDLIVGTHQAAYLVFRERGSTKST